MKFNNLALAMREYCPCCGRGGESAIEYVKEHDSDQVALYKEAIALGDCTGGDFLDIILSSDYDVFVPWYKAVLIYFKENGETGVTIQAESILKHYKEDFEKVGDLYEL